MFVSRLVYHSRADEVQASRLGSDRGCYRFNRVVYDLLRFQCGNDDFAKGWKVVDGITVCFIEFLGWFVVFFVRVQARRNEGKGSAVMNVWYSFLVGAGGFFGAVARYAVSQSMSRRYASFPYGTLFVNLLGSFLLGMIVGGKWGEPIVMLTGTGFMGAFTTFSTFKWEIVEMAKQKEWTKLFLYVGISYSVGIAFAFLGFITGGALTPSVNSAQ